MIGFGKKIHSIDLDAFRTMRAFPEHQRFLNQGRRLDDTWRLSDDLEDCFVESKIVGRYFQRGGSRDRHHGLLKSTEHLDIGRGNGYRRQDAKGHAGHG